MNAAGRLLVVLVLLCLCPWAALAARWEPSSCPPSVGVVNGVTCGWLTVPERRGWRRSCDVRLAVAIVAASSPRPGVEPLLYVSGGPGFASLPRAAGRAGGAFVADRDLILVDLRGTGSSQPSLSCPEVDDRLALAAPSDDRAARRADLAAIRACRDRLRREGVDLRAYGDIEAAADLADLRTALGIARWSVYGISNGGRLASELLRRHPDGISSVVLDAALPPHGNFYDDFWPHADRAITAFFAACANDPSCAVTHPDLERRFFDLVARLREAPVAAGSPAVFFDDARLIDVLVGALYDTSLLPVLPDLIELLAAGSGFDVVAGAVLDELRDPYELSQGQQLSVNCPEEIARLARPVLRRQARRLPRLAAAVPFDDVIERCRVWDVGRAPASVDRPVSSDVPTC